MVHESPAPRDRLSPAHHGRSLAWVFLLAVCAVSGLLLPATAIADGLDSAGRPLSERFSWVLLGTAFLTAVLVGVVVTVLERRRAQALRTVEEHAAALEQARQFQENLFTAGPVMVSRSRLPDLALTYVSPNVSRILGVPPPGALADDSARAERIHPEDWPLFDAARTAVARGHTSSATLELRVRAGQDSYHWVSQLIVADRDPSSGAIVGLLSYVIDINDRRRAEEGLREAQSTAESANVAKSEFLSRMSHELRTPLNAVLGFSQLLERDALTREQHESVGYIVKAGRHLLALIDEVLDISRIEAGTMSLSREPVHTGDVVAESVDLIQPLAETASVSLVQSGAEHWPHVLADHQRLKQILLNLLSNAVKYNVRGGTVTVSVEEGEAGTARISVTDTGPGIDAEQLTKLFVPFQRLGAERGPVEGTGIGLALSRQLAEAMGGRLDVASTAGRGSTFWVELPVTEAPCDRLTEPEHLTDDKGDRQMVTAHRDCILQIEDNPSNAKLMERLLESRPDIELIVAGLGQLGIDLAREHQPKLVLLDLHLPDISGEDVLQSLREDPGTCAIPVVVVSADGTHGQESRLLTAGALRYLTKPFDVNELLRIIDGTLAAS